MLMNPLLAQRCRTCSSVFKSKKDIKNREAFIKKTSQHFTHCGRWDLNPHDHTTTRSLVLPVCQFQHFRIYYLYCMNTVMQEKGLEPSRYCYHMDLNHARLPFRHSCANYIVSVILHLVK